MYLSNCLRKKQLTNRRANKTAMPSSVPRQRSPTIAASAKRPLLSLRVSVMRSSIAERHAHRIGATPRRLGAHRTAGAYSRRADGGQAGRGEGGARRGGGGARP